VAGGKEEEEMIVTLSGGPASGQRIEVLPGTKWIEVPFVTPISEDSVLFQDPIPYDWEERWFEETWGYLTYDVCGDVALYRPDE